MQSCFYNRHDEQCLADFFSTISTFCFELSCGMAVVAAKVDWFFSRLASLDTLWTPLDHVLNLNRNTRADMEDGTPVWVSNPIGEHSQGQVVAPANTPRSYVVEMPTGETAVTLFLSKTIQKVLTCLLSSSPEKPEARWNCSNLCFQCGHSSGSFQVERAGWFPMDAASSHRANA